MRARGRREALKNFHLHPTENTSSVMHPDSAFGDENGGRNVACHCEVEQRGVC